MSEEPGVTYPRSVRTAGDAPKQFGTAPEAVPVPEDFVEEELVEETGVDAEAEDGEGDAETMKVDEFSPTDPEADEEAPAEGED